MANEKSWLIYEMCANRRVCDSHFRSDCHIDAHFLPMSQNHLSVVTNIIVMTLYLMLFNVAIWFLPKLREAIMNPTK